MRDLWWIGGARRMEHPGEFSGLFLRRDRCGRGRSRVEATFSKRLCELADSIRSRAAGRHWGKRLLQGRTVRHRSRRGARLEQLLEIAGAGFRPRRRLRGRGCRSRTRLEHAREFARFLYGNWRWRERCRRGGWRLKHLRELADFGFGLRHWRGGWGGRSRNRRRLKHAREFAGFRRRSFQHRFGRPYRRGALRARSRRRQTIDDDGPLGSRKQFYELLV